MKYLIAALMVLAFASCKKTTQYTFTQADLIGKWAEVTPCIYAGQCWALEFRANDTVYESSPFVDTSAYIPISNGMIGINGKVVEGPTDNGIHTYSISGSDSTHLTIKYLIQPANPYTGTTNLNLIKTN